MRGHWLWHCFHPPPPCKSHPERCEGTCWSTHSGIAPASPPTLCKSPSPGGVMQTTRAVCPSTPVPPVKEHTHPPRRSHILPGVHTSSQAFTHPPRRSHILPGVHPSTVFGLVLNPAPPCLCVQGSPRDGTYPRDHHPPGDCQLQGEHPACNCCSSNSACTPEPLSATCYAGLRCTTPIPTQPAASRACRVMVSIQEPHRALPPLAPLLGVPAVQHLDARRGCGCWHSGARDEQGCGRH